MNALLAKKIEGFSNLSDEEGGIILEKYLLEGLESETLLESEMMAKFLVYPYTGREPIRKIFNSAIRRNKQIVGNKTVGEWLKKYGLTYNGKERDPNTFFEFVRDNAETRALSKRDQKRLMRIFRMYDYLLVDPIPGLDDIRMNILKFPMYLDAENSGASFAPEKMSEQDYLEESPKKIVSLPIQDALRQYPNLGEQGITNNPLKLSYFPTPVRPSIKNWITDFHNNMGPGKHSAMDRSNYLFHSENGKKVTPIERQRLSIILKSLEEKTLLKIDSEKQAIVFENNEQPVVNKQQSVISVSQEMGERKTNFKTTNDTEQKDIFQRYVPQAIKKPQPIFSTKIEEERKVQRSIQDENYFKNVGPKTNSRGDSYFNNFASIRDRNSSDQKADSAGGSVSFSSSQKLPVEQATSAAKTEEIKSNLRKPDMQSTPPKRFQQHSQWQMKPKSYKNNGTGFAELNEEANNAGNIVDLRN